MQPLWAVVESKYELLHSLGEGAYGQVMKARSKFRDEIVAIKWIKNYKKSEYYCMKVAREI